MSFSITRGNASDKERAAIAQAIASRRNKPVSRRSRWGEPQLRMELTKRSRGER